MQLSRLGSIFLLAATASAASLQQVADYGDNPAGVPMYIYVPDTLASNPAIVVALHYCTGSAEAYFNGTTWAAEADTSGFIVIYPSSPHSGACWDVSSPATLTANGGGDSNSIANMVKYTISQYSADASKVFVTGTSSGAMLTNVMAATYPSMFAAAAAYSGVAAGCFVSSTGGVDAWNSTCSQGQTIDTAEQWTSVVKAMGGTAPYPKMQIWHGSADTAVLPQNYEEEIKQWTGVHGVSQNATSIETDTPESGYTTSNYGTVVQGIYAEGVGHTVPVHVSNSMAWFGLS